MKKIILTILTSLSITLNLFSQESDYLGMLLITTDQELPKYIWACPKLSLSDSLILEKDSILMTKCSQIKNENTITDSSAKEVNKWLVVFEEKTNSLVIYYFDFLRSVKNRTETNRKIYMYTPYKSDLLKWSFDRVSQQLNITSGKNKWTFRIFEIDKNNLLLIKNK